MRIISGRLGGRRIKTVEGEGYRPAMGKTRESLFSMLTSRGVVWEGGRVLDLFAGSGSLAFEAVSRGAELAVLVENSAVAARCLADNIRQLGVEDCVRLIRDDVRKTLNNTPMGCFDLVFLDPPYRKNLLNATLQGLLKRNWLAPGALICAGGTPFWSNPHTDMDTRMKLALYPGTFDPLTNGHLALIRRGLAVFDQIVVAVADNTPKFPLFSQEERVAMAREAVGDDDRILVEPFTGLTVEYAAKRGACAILRGLRAVSDFEYEFQLALMNRRLQRDIQTVFLMTDYQWLFISSTIVKAAASHGADIVGLVPENVCLRLMEKYQRGEVRQATPCLSAPYGGFRVNK